MAEKNRFSKPVAFNNKNADDQKILNHVKRRNFSGYVKKLILADIKAHEMVKAFREPTTPVIEQPQPMNAADRLAALREQQQKRTGSQPGPKTHLSD